MKYNLSLNIVIILLLFLFTPAILFAQQDYKVGPGDVLDITVWKEPNLTKVITVDEKGNINLPLLGEVSVLDFNCKQTETLLSRKLKEGGYILDPKVNVLVKEYKSKKIMIFGLTSDPGIHYLKGKADVLELISETGIIQSAGTMVIHRGALNRREDFQKPLSETSKNSNSSDDVLTVDLHALLAAADLSQNIQIKPGDIIYISTGTKFTVYVMGEVKNPGPYTFNKGLTLLKAIDKAGGTSQFASINKIKILREKENSDEKEEIRIRMKDIERGDKSQDIELKPGDVVVVPQSWF